jgi:para-aminobenzoate synthetase component 1
MSTTWALPLIICKSGRGLFSTAGLADEFKTAEAKPSLMGSQQSGTSSNFTRESYEAAVVRTVEYILAGDIFQANISQCFSAKIPDEFDALAFYKKLRALNPATFSAFLDYGDVQIASSSPERLLSFDGTTVEARPIKGTRRRDPNPALDATSLELIRRKDWPRMMIATCTTPGHRTGQCAPVLCGGELYLCIISPVYRELKPDKQ